MTKSAWLSVPLLLWMGCAGDDDPATTGETGTPAPDPTADTGDTEEPTDTVPTDTAPPPPDCLQDSAVASGNVTFFADDVTIDADTLAVTTSAPAPSVALPGSVDDVDYYGAVDPNAASPWWQGWTFQDPFSVDGSLPGGGYPLAAAIIAGEIVGSPQSACSSLGGNYADGGTVDIFQETFPVCIVTGRITEDVSWPNNHVFFLAGPVIVGTGDQRLRGGEPTTSATLTIQPGTQVYGASGVDNSLLLVTRGSQLVAEGTPDLPIVFSGALGNDKQLTDGNLADLTQRGIWGGVILEGRARVNTANSDAEDDSFYLGTWYGGTDDADSSGTLRYAIIAESGDQIGGGNNPPRTPGLLLEGVGKSTTIDFVQVLTAEADCIGAFGGTTDLRHVVCNGTGDDSFDVDAGYSGSLQYGIVRLGAENGNNGIEADGNGGNFDAEPTTSPVFANVTVLGNVGNGDADGQGASRGVFTQEGARIQVYRSVFADDDPVGGSFDDGCLDIDDIVPNELQLADVIFDCSPDPLSACENGEDPQ